MFSAFPKIPQCLYVIGRHHSAFSVRRPYQKQRTFSCNLEHRGAAYWSTSILAPAATLLLQHKEFVGLKTGGACGGQAGSASGVAPRKEASALLMRSFGFFLVSFFFLFKRVEQGISSWRSLVISLVERLAESSLASRMNWVGETRGLRNAGVGAEGRGHYGKWRELFLA